jgi:hypothetical protein
MLAEINSATKRWRATIAGQFTCEQARTKLKKRYPVVKTQLD